MIDFPSQAAREVYARRGTFAARCHTAEEAECEVYRLIRGIDGFHPDCRVIEVRRMADDPAGWDADIDDPRNEFEFETFTIFDNGDMDWT